MEMESVLHFSIICGTRIEATIRNMATDAERLTGKMTPTFNFGFLIQLYSAWGNHCNGTLLVSVVDKQAFFGSESKIST
jgi:hypothetical protein